MAALKPVKKRVRVSKNKKKSWGKFCDITEVEDYLEEKRFDERIGGAVSEKSNEELFFLQNDSTKPVDAKRIKKPLKCHQNIGSFSKVPAPVILNNQKYSKKIKHALCRADEKRWKRNVAKASKERKEPETNFKNGELFTTNLKDLWAESTENEDSEMKDLITYRDEITKERRPNVPCHRYQKPSLLPSVEVPHAGASYNPSYMDHQRLLLEAVKVEEKKLKEELHLKRVLTDMFPTKADAPTPESILKEMSQGLFDDDDADEEESDLLYSTKNPPVSFNDRLPRSRKRKRKELKIEAREKKLEKLQNKRISDIYRLRSIKSAIKKKDELTQKKMEKRFQIEIEKMYKPRTLSKHKYESPDLELNLTEELCGSLRTLKTEGNLLEDRYKSLQRRNMIETRVKQKRKRKYKLKVQVKRSHRNFK